jgi:hypothetical protein
MSQTVSYLWREPKAAEGFKAGVSLHSHTNQSKETLDFIAELSTDWGRAAADDALAGAALRSSTPASGRITGAATGLRR